MKIPLAVALLTLAMPWTSVRALASGGPEDTSGEIAEMKKRMAEQDARISELEKRLALLETRLDGAPPAAGNPSASISPEGMQAADVQAASPGNSVSTAKPEIKIAGVNVSGDIYLYQYVPFDVSGARPKFDLYAFALTLTGHHGPWEFYSQYRLRTDKLRSFYPGNTWLQQGYVAYNTDYGKIMAGSFYRNVGIAWDDSFFGNIQYFDGLKLDPEYGIAFQGSHLFSKRFSADYSVQYLTYDAGINGSLPGRDFVSEPNAHDKNDVTLRIAPVWHFSNDASLTVGGSYANGTITRDGGPHNGRRQYAGDATAQWRGLLAYGEILQQDVTGDIAAPPQNATYSLLGVRWNRGRFQPRLNYSQGNYHGFDQRHEYIFQPGFTVRLSDGFSFIYEFDYWKETSVPNPFLIDKSLNFVLLYHF